MEENQNENKEELSNLYKEQKEENTGTGNSPQQNYYQQNGYGQAPYQNNYYQGNYYNGNGQNPTGKQKKSKGTIAALIAAGVVATASILVVTGVVGYRVLHRVTDRTVSTFEADQPVPENEQKSVAGESITSRIKNTEVVDGSELKSNDVSSIVENVMPSIVSVNCMIKQSAYFLGEYYGDQEGESRGSGVILDENDSQLLIVTNNHVIDGATKIQVAFIDNEEVEATVKGADADMDLAVLAVAKKDVKEETLSRIKTIAIGNSDELKVGEMAIAIGNSLGYGQSVTVGYVSAKDRTVQLEDRQSSNLIQTDAAINPGNSGGALLNSRGELIGINSVKYSSQAVEGMGYAIAITDASSMIEELKNTEQLAEEEKGYLGITCADVSSARNKEYRMPVGVYVADIAKGSAAEEAGLVVGDIITKVNGNEVQTTKALQQRVQNKRVGTSVDLTIERFEGGEYKEKEITVVLGDRSSLKEMEEKEKERLQEEQKKQEENRQDEYQRQMPDDFGDLFEDFFGQ